jgi:predicted metalloprotease with PDZ domain
VNPLRYEVDLSRHRQHLVTVRIDLPPSARRVVLPVWTPGSYVVRDHVRHVQTVSAYHQDGRQAELTRDGRSAWLLAGDAARLELEIYANEPTVRTNHVDDRHALLTPAATFPFVEGAQDRPHHVTIRPPNGWRTWSLLPETDGMYVAEDYDLLVDSAFEAGDHPSVGYVVAGIPHEIVWAGPDDPPDLEQVAGDAAAIGEAAVSLFGGDLPVERYTVLCVTWDKGAGGLERRDGAVLQLPVRQRHRAPVHVDIHDLAHPDLGVPLPLEDMAQRTGNVARRQRGRRDLVQQGLKQMEVAAVDQCYGGTRVAQRARAVHAA